MSHTNSTTNYNLPQFLTTDKPAWLTDVNNAYLAIDTAMKNNADAASTADTKATNAGEAATTADTKATAAKSAADGAIASIADDFSPSQTYVVGDIVMYNNLLYICTEPITTPGAWTGSANWDRKTVEEIIDSKVSDLQSQLNSKAVSINTTWGTTVASDFTHKSQFIVLVSSGAVFQVWFSGTDNVAVRELKSATATTGQNAVVVGDQTFTRTNETGATNIFKLTVTSTSTTAMTIIN